LNTKSNLQPSIKSWIWAGMFAALTAVGAFVRIPLPYVQLTLQLVFVMLAGDILTPKFAMTSQLIYLLIGLVGLPVFANGGGPSYILQPTFGYLAAFPLAAWLVAWLLRARSSKVSYCNRPRFLDFLIANSAGIIVIFIFGVSYLFVNINIIAGGRLPIRTAIWTGMIIFMPVDIIKILLTSVLAVEIHKRLGTNWKQAK